MSENLKSWQNFVVNGYQLASIMDSRRSSHPLEGLPSESSGIDQLFDDITYKKGCAVLKMLSERLGEKLFLAGLRQFLTQYAYRSIETEDLWNVLTQVSGVDIGAIMSVWTKYVGYPVVSVTEDESSGAISVTQNRFFMTGDTAMADDMILFPIFLNIRCGSGILEEKLVERTKTIKVPPDFYKVNADQTGFYRVAYSPARLRKIGGAISASKGLLSAKDRAGIVSDTMALVFSGYPDLKASNLLSLLQNFASETCYFVWKTVLSTLQELSQYLASEDGDTLAALGRFQKQLVKNCLDRVLNLPDNDNINDQRFKALIFSNSGKMTMLSKQHFPCSTASSKAMQRLFLQISVGEYLKWS
jgi:aminopeptidase 2